MGNPDLRLTLGDVEVLCSLGRLAKLDLSKDWQRNPVTLWSGEDMKVAWALCKRLPDLECNFLTHENAFG